MSETNPNTRGVKGLAAKGAILLATILWGSSFFLFKQTLDSLPGTLTLAIRFTLSSAALALIFIKRVKQAGKSHIGRGLLCGAALFLGYYFQTLGLAGTTPGKNAFLTGVYCVVVPFVNWLVKKKKPTLSNVLAAFLCFGGIGLVALDSGTIVAGDMLTLIGGCMFAIHIVIAASVLPGRDAIVITVWQLVGVAILSWIFTFIFDGVPSFVGCTSGEILTILYLTFACTLVALLCQSFGQQNTPPAPAAILLSLEAVFGVIFSIILYHEKVSLRVGCGFAVIFIAILISELGGTLTKKAKESDNLSCKN